ncbi:MAG: response regulator, partial [Nitrospirae bacterium]
RLMLLDMQMPEMDGEALARAVRAEAALAATRMVLLSSVDRRGDERALKRAGLDAVLLKPVGRSQLFDTLAEVVAGGGAEAEGGGAAETAAPEPRTTRPLSVLLAEDNAVNRLVAVKALERLGHRVTAVADGAAAVEAWAAGGFDLVLMDCQMPVMDGYRATAEIRAREAERGGPRTPIVALTANAMAGDREQCLAAGMDDHLAKPVRGEALAACLERWAPEAAVEAGEAAPEAAGEPAAEAGASEEGAGGEAPPPETPAIDAARLREIAGGDRAFARELLHLFLEDAQGHVAALAEAVARGEAEAVRQVAHTLKGSAANVGAEGVQRAALALERCGREADLAQAEPLLASLRSGLEAVRRASEE